MINEIPTIGIAMPTDEDWGRLYQFNTTGDAGLVMPLRSYYFRDFFSGSWNDLSIGMIHCECGLTGDTSNTTNERQTETNAGNLFHFGISQSIGGAIDVIGNPTFLGLRGIIGGITQINASLNNLGMLYATCVEAGIANVNGPTFQMDLSKGVSGSPFSMLGIRFIYNALASTVTVSFETQTGIALADEAANVSTLTTFLQAIDPTPMATFTIYNITNFKTFFVYWPYLLNKMKLHCVGIVKNS